ncbi:MAG: YggT family protein [Clostridia bacterium]|nr:YggT family protein [Clostridia bacterium]
MSLFLYRLVDVTFEAYRWILIARILLSWIGHDPYHPLIKFVYRVTDPILEPLSRVIPPIGMIDVSPIIAFIILGLLKDLVLGFVGGLAAPGLGF